jgi:formylglycine-generating enzyme required for sulfatase activity
MAIQHLEPVYKKQPNDTEVRNMLSKAYHARGQSEADHANFDKAKQDYRKAYEVHNTKEYREAANAKLETVKISGDVRDDEGKPISHAEIRTHGRKVEEGTDEDGNFAVDVQSLSPGSVPVSISAEDHGPYSENIIIEIESGKYEYTLSAVLMRGGPMVLIPAGEFQMGSDDGSNNERPIHTVYLDAFYMDVHEVTNAQYKAFMDTTKHPAPRYLNDSNFNAPNQPVVGVSWYDAATYCQWAGKRLPTEAEWEKAARGGLVGARYPWGDEEPEQARVSYNPNAANPALVGSYPPNGYGLYDMAGNVWEWCLDEYQADFYAKSAKENPFPEGDIDSVINNFTSITVGRVLRGGSWVNDNLRVAARHRFNPSFTFNFVGFRCARALNP